LKNVHVVLADAQLHARPNPKYAWQAAVSGGAAPANDGILFEDAWYDMRELRCSVLLANEEQKKTCERILAETDVPPEVTDGKKPVGNYREFGLKALLATMQAQARADNPTLASRALISHAYF